MTPPDFSHVTRHIPEPIQSRGDGKGTSPEEEAGLVEGDPPSSFRRKWRVIQSLLVAALLLAIPNRFDPFDKFPGHGKVSDILGVLPTILLAVGGWMVLQELVTSRRLARWFLLAILLGLANGVLNFTEKVPAWRFVPFIGDEGFLHTVAEATVELACFLVFFLAFAKSILALRAATHLAEAKATALEREVGLRAQLQEGLIEERNEAQWLAEKLADLHQMATSLSESTGVYDLCHRAVTVGRCRLGFDRLGIWLLGEIPGHLYGTYGVDESGTTRDERHRVVPFPDHFPSEIEVLRSKSPLILSGRGSLWNDQGEVVGEGDHAVGALWDGDSVVGELTADTLFSGGSFSPASLQLLCVYANVVGHHLTQKRLEESLQRAHEVEERLHTLLSALHQVTLELALTESVDDLCRESVRAGKSRLSFSRVEIRLRQKGSNELCGTYCSGEDGHVQDLSNSTWDRASLDPVSEAALADSTRPVSACPLTFRRPGDSRRHESRIWRNAVPLSAMGGNNGILILDHLLPMEGLSMADLEIALLFGEALSQLLHNRLQDEQRRKWTAQMAQTQRLESLGTLAGGIAHDFNNILGAMIGFTEMALAETPPTSSVREMQEQVLRAGFRAKELVRQILTFSRRTATSSSDPILPHLIVKEALNLVRASLPSSIRIHTDIQKDCGCVLAEPTHVHQIVVNLCTNAFQAMRHEGDLLEVRLESIELLEASSDMAIPPGKYVHLVVRDNGIGMDEETLQRACEPFFTTKAVGEGTGLGLSTVQGIASSLGGALHISSSKGEGTTVEVYLPQCALPETHEAGPAQRETRDLTRRRVLVVDDEVAVGLVTTKQLERLGHSVTVVTSPFEALDLVRKRPDSYDLLLTDLTMPGMTGLRLAELVHEICPTLPTLLVSGNLDPNTNVDERQQLGVVDVLQKPVALQDLAQCLNRLFTVQKVQPKAPEWPGPAPRNAQDMPG